VFACPHRLAKPRARCETPLRNQIKKYIYNERKMKMEGENVPEGTALVTVAPSSGHRCSHFSVCFI
jgi:hypothetical protein